VNLAALPPEELLDRAREIAPSARTHWSVPAQLIGGVEDRRLYDGFGYASTRAWAEAEMGASHDKTRALYGLWQLMVTATAAVPPVPMELWPLITEGKASLVRRAVRAGIPVAQLVAAAIAADNEDALREWIARRTGAELPWVTIEIPAPTEFVPVFETTLVHALRELEDIVIPDDFEAALALVATREVRVRALEVVCAAYFTGPRRA